MKKTITAALAALLAVMLILCGCAAKTENGIPETDAATAAQTEAQTEALETAALSIVFDSTVEESISSVAVNLPSEALNMTLHEGETALSILKTACEENDIALVESSGYVTGIAGISTGDAGANSGWMFKLNGELASVGAGDCVLSDGDSVEWFYTADFNIYFN